jgi:hypothetical protein
MHQATSIKSRCAFSHNLAARPDDTLLCNYEKTQLYSFVLDDRKPPVCPRSNLHTVLC